MATRPLCEGWCSKPATHIGNRGYVYCPECAIRRRKSGAERTRKMTGPELKLIKAGRPIGRY